MAGKALRRSLYSSFLGQWIAAAAMVGSSLVVARLLTPDELGVYTVAMGLTVIVQALQYVGGSEYVLYSHTLDEADRRAAFGISVCGAIAAAGVLALLAQPAAAFYRNEGMVGLMLIFGLNILIGVLAAPIASMLMRQERFMLTSTSTAMTSVVQSSGSILFILMGFKYYAMAMAGTVAAVASVAYLCIVGREHILWRPSLKGARKLLSFSGVMFALNVLDQVYNVIPQILIGRISSLSAAAMYGRANVITQIYGQVIQRAVDPVVAARIAATRREGEEVGQVYFTASNMLLAVAGAFFGFVALYAHKIVPILFGDQWGEAVLPMRLLCLGFVAWPLMSPTSSLLISAGRQNTLLKLRAFMTALRFVAVAIAAHWGLVAAAATMTATIYVNMLVSITLICRVSSLSISTYFLRLTGSVSAAGVALAAAAVAMILTQSMNLGDVAVVLIGGVVLGLAWAAMLAVLRHALFQEALVLLGAIDRLRRRRRA